MILTSLLINYFYF